LPCFRVSAATFNRFASALVFNLLTLTEKGNIMNFITKFIREEDGVTAIEYGLIAALIAVVIIAAVTLIGTNLNVVFGDVAAALVPAAPPPAP
jgi:pilus assembly protein Flp/PilA